MQKQLPLAFIFCLATSAWVKKETYIRYIREEADGQVFAHRAKVADGVVETVWTINDKPVSEEDYHERYVAARTSELKVERQAQQAAQHAHEQELAEQQKFARNARVLVHKKAVQEQIGAIEKLLAQVKNPRLEPYYVFGEQSFASRELFLQVSNELITQAKVTVARSEDELTETELMTLATQLEQQPTRLRNFYRNTVKHAINSCDDTRMLKEFLELLA
jgi:hypothetical protein